MAGQQQYSSFQIGKMLDVSRQAVNQWIDKGYIVSYRTPGGHRRVRREDLIDFLKARKIPIPPGLQEDMLASGSGAKIRIFLVDDDPDYLSLMENALSDRLPAARIQTFENGYDALVALGTNPPDLLVLDLKMPNVNGVEICRRLKENDRTRQLHIVVVSAYDTPEWLENLRTLQVEDVYPKSTPLVEIADQIAAMSRKWAVPAR